MSVRGEILGNLMKLALSFEILYPLYIQFFTGRALRDFKRRGLISSYEVKARRSEKLHYVIQIDLYKCEKKGGEKK